MMDNAGVITRSQRSTSVPVGGREATMLIPTIKNQAFVDLLVQRDVVTRGMADRLNLMHNGDAFAVLRHLLKTTPHQKTLLARLWGDSIGITYVDLAKSLIQRDVVRTLPEEFSRKNLVIVLYEFGDAVTAAFSDPTNDMILREAERLSGKTVSPVFALPDDILSAIDLEYQSEDHLKELSSRIVTESIIIEDITDLTRDELQGIAGSQGVVEFVKGILFLAIKQRASDVHIEPTEDKARIRFRIDGVLQEKSTVDKTLLAPVLSRLKILAELDITERRRPQDGRISVNLPNRNVDIRFSSIPTVHGEKVVMRVLGESGFKDIPDLSSLGFSKGNLDRIKRIMQTPYGIFFVTGPTGSGKTTTLFSMLKHLNKPGVNITTIEDPVEYRLPGISQVQVNSAVDLDFPSALRSFLRQDPDIILVGEIRDQETAEIACRAALTGHLVLATLHANNSLQATTRLIDMGVHANVVAPSMVGIMAQRLVRKICTNCKEKYTPSPEELKKFTGLEDSESVSFYRGGGCSQCSGSGFAGRLAIHEMLAVNDEMRSLLLKGALPSEIGACAHNAGYQSMRYDGVKKVLRGLTTIDELERVTMADEGSD